VQFVGMPILAEGECLACSRHYWLDWPAGHARLHPTIVDADSAETYFDGLPWYARRVQSCVISRGTMTAAISVQSSEKSSGDVVVLNCIDFLYGHCLLKLLSGLRYLREHPDMDAVVITPKLLSWLVPTTVRAVVEVDLPLAQGGRWIDNLDDTLQNLLAPYARAIIAPAVSQPQLTADDLAQLKPGFAPQRFWDGPAEVARQLTLVLRTDRPWLAGNRVLGLLQRFVPRRYLEPTLLLRQRQVYRAVVRRVRRQLPGLRVVVVGLGTPGGFPDDINDLRLPTVSQDQELMWAAEYARSGVVLGVHGSNMLLPSALGGAVVILCPRHKWQNVTQDLVITDVEAREPKLALWRYRILPASTRARDVADVIVSIYRNSDFHHHNILENRPRDGVVGWPRPVSWHRLSEPS